MPITLLDLILLIVMLISGLLAMIRGFIREVLSIAAWGLAAAAGVYAYAKLLPMFKGSFGSDIVTAAVVVGGAFLLTLLIVSIITVRISDMILDSRVGALDRTLGFVFGLARGLIIVVVAFLFFSWLVPPKTQPEWVRNAKSRVVLDQDRPMADLAVAGQPGKPVKSVQAAQAGGPESARCATRSALRGPPHGPRGLQSHRYGANAEADRTQHADAIDADFGQMDERMSDSHSTASQNWHLDDDRLREECGVFGIFGHPDAAAITALGLHALQHRGQEAAGIVSFDGKRFHSERRLGLVGDTFSRRDVIEHLPGMSAIGHVRYSTTGETVLRNVQPLFAELDAGGFAVGHNGNLTNGLTLRRELVRDGAMMQSTTDTEVILHLVARARRNRFVDRFIEALRAIEGAYSLTGLTNKKLVGARDPYGIRPLVIGKLDGCPILASETCALDIIGAQYVRDVENGEIVVFDEEGTHSHKPFPPMAPRPMHLRIYLFRPA